MDKIIQLEGIKKTYMGKHFSVQALREINFSVKRQEMIGIMGPSGSGKTTLLNILGLIDTPTEGTYLLEGKNVSELKDKERAKLRNQTFGFVLQEFALIGQYSAEKNVMLPLQYSDFPKKEWKERSRIVLEQVGISDKQARYPAELSGGQKQRAAIARALVAESKILLADEPTGALDSGTGREIMELFSEVRSRGKTIIIVTHDDHVAAYCDRIVRIEDGCSFTALP